MELLPTLNLITFRRQSGQGLGGGGAGTTYRREKSPVKATKGKFAATSVQI